MSTNVRVRVPKALIEQAAKPGNTVKALLEQALSLGLTPVHTTSVLCMYVSVYLGSSLASDIELSAPNEPIARTCQGLLAALFLHQKTEQKTVGKLGNGSKTINDYFDARPEQSLLFENAKSLFEHNEAAGIIEAATGVGKGRALIATAIYAYEKTREPVVVCAPTIQILSQLCDEFFAINEESRNVLENNVTLLLGKDNFVSETLLRMWLDSDDEISDITRKSIENWLLNGAGHTNSDFKSFYSLIPKATFLLADAKAIAPEAPWDELTISELVKEKEADLGYRSYLMCRANEGKQSRLILTTHSMVVMDCNIKIKNDDGFLGQYKTLVIDEAHTFASIAESMFSKQGAIRSIIAELSDSKYWKSQRKLTLSQQALSKVKSIGDELKVLLSTCNSERINLNETENREKFSQCINKLGTALEAIAANQSQYSKISNAYAICKALNKGSMRVDLVASAVRGYPSLIGGPTNLSGFFMTLFKRIKHLVLLSATCYVPGVNGQLNAGLLLTSLNITNRFGIDGVKKFSPIIPNWLYDSVQLIETQEKALCYPSNEDKSNECNSVFEQNLDNWHRAVADRIKYIASHAAGGTLVLLPSYESIKKIAESLPELNVIEQTAGSFSDCFSAFKQAYKSGIKVVWLATGSAWTGLDCSDSDVSAEEDFLLTDLVIPKIPFGVERSLAHTRRQKILPTAERDRALFQFKQGVGRLIRRPGLLNRKLWILDSRIYTAKKPWLFKPFQYLLSKYPNQVFIEKNTE